MGERIDRRITTIGVVVYGAIVGCYVHSFPAKWPGILWVLGGIAVWNVAALAWGLWQERR